MGRGMFIPHQNTDRHAILFHYLWHASIKTQFVGLFKRIDVLMMFGCGRSRMLWESLGGPFFPYADGFAEMALALSSSRLA